MTEKNFVPKGAASFNLDYEGTAKDMYFLLLPKLTMLALSAALEPLRIANQICGKELYRWYLMSEGGVPVRCSNEVLITPDSDLKQLPKESRLFVCSGIEPLKSTTKKTLSWLNQQSVFGSKLGSICTGAFALADLGLLGDRRFTLHWENQPSFCEAYPDLVPSRNLYEIDRGLMTCGGGNSATDMMLDMIEADFGKELAVVVSDMCIHLRSNTNQTIQKSGYSVALGSRNPKLIGAVRLMNENIEDPLKLTEIADYTGVSRRQLERLFQKYLGQSPVDYYTDLRVSRAYALLSETEMSVGDIAVATGFGSKTHLIMRFKKKYHQTPMSFRRGWSQDG